MPLRSAFSSFAAGFVGSFWWYAMFIVLLGAAIGLYVFVKKKQG